MKNNDVLNNLKKYDLIDDSNIGLYHKGTRDNKDLDVMKCNTTGIIFIQDSSHIDSTHYKNTTSYWGDVSINVAQIKTEFDDKRRVNEINNICINKKLLDVGAGNGGFVKHISKYADITHAVELQDEMKDKLIEYCDEVLDRIDIANDEYYDVITTFHVLEHIADPYSFIKNIYDKLNSSGKLILEVPNANDLLIKLKCKEFISNTLWSEHLILYTRAVLEKLLKSVGFVDVIIRGIQRYPISNHIQWFNNGKPNGHNDLCFLNDMDLHNKYELKLASIDATDTLFLYANK